MNKARSTLNSPKSMSNAPKTSIPNKNPNSVKATYATKFWGIWLPVPTFLAIANSLFWTWLILRTVGYTVAPIEKAGEWMIEEF
jgi:hypothetical protein